MHGLDATAVSFNGNCRTTSHLWRHVPASSTHDPEETRIFGGDRLRVFNEWLELRGIICDCAGLLEMNVEQVHQARSRGQLSVGKSRIACVGNLKLCHRSSQIVLDLLAIHGVIKSVQRTTPQSESAPVKDTRADLLIIAIRSKLVEKRFECSTIVTVISMKDARHQGTCLLGSFLLRNSIERQTGGEQNNGKEHFHQTPLTCDARSARISTALFISDAISRTTYLADRAGWPSRRLLEAPLEESAVWLRG